MYSKKHLIYIMHVQLVTPQDATMSQTLSAREKSSMTGDDEEGHPDEIQISKELFLLVIQARWHIDNLWMP